MPHFTAVICNMRNTWRFSCLQFHCTSWEGGGSHSDHLHEILGLALSQWLTAGVPHWVLCPDNWLLVWDQAPTQSVKSEVLLYQACSKVSEGQHELPSNLSISAKCCSSYHSKVKPLCWSLVFVQIFWGEYVFIITLCSLSSRCLV